MHFSGTLFLAITGLAIVAIAIGLTRAVVGNSRTGMQHRARILDRIKPLRLHKMLAVIGIDEGQYLHKARLAEIERHIHRCEHCDEKRKCDEQLEQEDSSHADQYCPNNQDLVRLNRSR